MKLTLSLTSLVFFGFAQIASSMPIIPGVNLTPKNDEKPIIGCTDFSGKWKGSCKTSDGKEFNFETSYNQNGCEFIVSGGFTMPIGGVMKLGMITPPSLQPLKDASDMDVTVSMDWSPDKTFLKGVQSAFFKTLGIAGQTFAAAYEYSVAILDGKLVISVKDKEKEVVSCTAEKI